MATYLHFAPALALAVAVGPKHVPWRLALVGMLCGVLPDADFISVWLHWDAYSGPYGHRGFTHSLGFALLLGLVGALFAARGARWSTAVYVSLCTASHPLLDGLFDRGICNAWLWPLDAMRQCLPWRPIPMRGVGLFGWARWWHELVWIGLPCLLLANFGLAVRTLWRICLARSQATATCLVREAVPGPKPWRLLGLL